MKRQPSSGLLGIGVLSVIPFLLIPPTLLPAAVIGEPSSECTDVEYVELLFPALTDSMVIYVNGTFLCKDGRCGSDLTVTGDLRVDDGRMVQTYRVSLDVKAQPPPDDNYAALSAVVELTALGINFGGGIGNASLSIGASEVGMATLSARVGVPPDPFHPPDPFRFYSVGVSTPRFVPVR